MQRGTLVVIIVAGSWLAAFARAEESVPMRWLAHDMQRSRPPVVTPADQHLPIAPPSDATVIFDGQDLSQWRDAEGGPAKWRVRDGYMESVPNSGYVFTAGKFGDIQLHIEWATPTPASGSGQGRGNSGVFLMGLYEVQVLDSYENETYADGQAGAIYGQYPPLVNACLPPGQWQSYDIVFRRPRFHAGGTLARPARITVLHNGVLVQNDVEIFGPTAWLQHVPYKKLDDKLPISLQDHGNPVRYRNIWLRELPEADLPTALAETEPATVKLSPDELKKFTGAYGSILGELGTIELEGDTLRVHMKTGQVMDLVPRSATEFALRHTAGKLDFNVQDGRVAGFTMHLGGSTYPVKRNGDVQ
jgi:hypothetical protein